MRPWLSVTGTRWTRCPPPSYLNAGQAPSPDDEERDAVEPAALTDVGGQRLGAQPVPGGVGEVHLAEVAGEQVGLLAAFGAADLDDDVAPGVRIRRHHQVGELGGGRLEGVVGDGELLLERAALVVGRLGEQLPGGLGVGEQRSLPASERDDGRELVVPASRPCAALAGSTDDGRIGEARFEVGVLVLDGGESGGDGIAHGV